MREVPTWKGVAMADDISTEWTGHDLLDINGEKIGTVEDVRFGDATGGLKWLLVKTGIFGTKKVLVPAAEIKATEDALVVPFPKDRVKDSPGVDDSDAFTESEERNICSYYGLDHVSAFDAPVEGCVDEEEQTPAPVGGSSRAR
jgi:sporulation protein YlmC with PRC-barrel domain